MLSGGVSELLEKQNSPMYLQVFPQPFPSFVLTKAVQNTASSCLYRQISHQSLLYHKVQINI